MGVTLLNVAPVALEGTEKNGKKNHLRVIAALLRVSVAMTLW